MNFLKSVLSGPDNVTGDEIKVGFFLVLVTFIGLTIWGVIHDHQKFDSQLFCFGFATLVGAVAAGVAGKQFAKAMPPADAPPTQ